MPWGRYSGYFFYVYRTSGKILFGPYDSREAAEKDKQMIPGKSGQVFQRERPARIF
jgi:hypothetical protein